jgi:hypothetical protein
MKKQGYNTNLYRGRRPHRGSSRSYKGVNIQDMNLNERLLFESLRLKQYLLRVNQ